MENSIKEDIERLKLCSTNQCNICGRYEKEECMLERNRCEQHILSDYKRVLKENEEIKNEYFCLKNRIENTIRYTVDIIVGNRPSPLAINTSEPQEIVKSLLKVINTIDNEIIEYTVKEAE